VGQQGVWCVYKSKHQAGKQLSLSGRKFSLFRPKQLRRRCRRICEIGWTAACQRFWLDTLESFIPGLDPVGEVHIRIAAVMRFNTSLNGGIVVRKRCMCVYRIAETAVAIDQSIVVLS